MHVSAILTAKGSTVHTIGPQATVAGLVDALNSLGVGALVVSPDGRTVAGIVSERDVVRALQSGGHALDTQVNDIMTARVTTTTPEATVDELAVLMTSQRIRHVPVLGPAGDLVGLVSIGDVVKWRLDELEDERQALLGYITQG